MSLDLHQEKCGRVRKRSFSSAGAVFAILAAAILFGGEKTEARIVRIGVYDNPPKVEMGPGGKPRGIFIDIIKYIAEREAWDLQYVYGTWDEGLTRLEQGNIDLMPDVAFSDVRSQRFAFNQLTVLCSWLQVFSGQNVTIGSMADLEGKTIAVLAGSIQETACTDIREQFGLTFNMVTLPDYKSTVSQVESGKADAAIVSRFYGYSREKKDALAPTPVILYPTALFFAAPKGRNQDLLDAIDKHLAKIMNDPHSVYYRSLAYWLQERPRMFVPQFVLWTIVSIVVILMFFFVLSLVLRWQVKKRTEELSEKNIILQRTLEELKLARDEALQRERLHAFGQLASGAAHDFNNLLIPIVGYADLLLSDPKALNYTEDTRRSLEAIRTAAGHGTEIVRRMQAFSQSTAHGEEKSHVDTNAVIREVVELGKQRLMGRVSIEVVLKLGSHCEIEGRKAHIHEMLLNLVLNAADAMPEGGRLEISTERMEDAVRITVKDTGIGMTGEVREKCLQPFFTTKGAKGTGMGLTMVNNIVAEHGGHLEIVSTMGAGTTFTITFPRVGDSGQPLK